MPRARVYIRATFVSTKAAKAPYVYIDRPSDISELAGEINVKAYEELKTRISEIVNNSDNGLYFHKDEDHIYRFDETALPNGGIYGLKDRRASPGDMSRITASKLVPIKSASDFERNCDTSGQIEYRLSGRSGRKMRKPSEYTIELCIVLIKERVKRTVSAPASAIVCPAEGELSLSLNSSSGRSSGTKRKSAPPPFTFKATKLCISLYAPIETLEKKAGITTGVPSGKTMKEVSYDLSGNIVREDDSNSVSGSIDGDDSVAVVDEEFSSAFTLSIFRRDLMVLACEQFGEEYAISKKSLGPKCKLFFQKLWNSSAWMEITSTEMLHNVIKDQIMTKGRVKNGALQMRISFGRAKGGQEFTTDRDMHDYVCVDFGDGVKFSQSGEATSPYIRKVGKVKRDECWNKPARIAELISTLYSSAASKLHFGFLKEHGNSFYRIIAANLSIHKDNSVFLAALNDPDNNKLDDEVITRDILSVFVRSHQNDLPGGPMPETGKYPPMNATMMVMPPTFREWNSTQQQQRFNIFGMHNVTPTGVPTSDAVVPTIENEVLVGITFRANWDDDEEVSVMVEGSLNLDSTMEELMIDGDVCLELGNDASDAYKYMIQKRSGGKLTLKWVKFKDMKVRNLMRIKNVHEDYIVIMKKVIG